MNDLRAEIPLSAFSAPEDYVQGGAVEVLRAALARAEAGEVTALALVLSDRNGMGEAWVVGDAEDRRTLTDGAAFVGQLARGL